jgi:hypothetical protein
MKKLSILLIVSALFSIDLQPRSISGGGTTPPPNPNQGQAGGSSWGGGGTGGLPWGGGGTGGIPNPFAGGGGQIPAGMGQGDALKLLLAAGLGAAAIYQIMKNHYGNKLKENQDELEQKINDTKTQEGKKLDEYKEKHEKQLKEQQEHHKKTLEAEKEKGKAEIKAEKGKVTKRAKKRLRDEKSKLHDEYESARKKANLSSEDAREMELKMNEVKYNDLSRDNNFEEEDFEY